MTTATQRDLIFLAINLATIVMASLGDGFYWSGYVGLVLAGYYFGRIVQRELP